VKGAWDFFGHNFSWKGSAMAKKIFLAVAALLGIALSVTAGDKAWLDGKVVALGHTSDNGRERPTATILLSDPGNSNPLMREQAWIISANPAFGKPKVILGVGTAIRAYRTGETASHYGSIAIRYEDNKGREKSELHPIAGELDPAEVQR
jgi:hypothetical protein